MDHHLRLQWARHHLNALDVAIQAFKQTDPYKAVTEFNEETGGYTLRISEVAPVPVEIALITGDVVHSLNSALDNLVFALAVKESGETAAKADTALQFPISFNSDKYLGLGSFKNNGDCRRVRLLSSGARTVIEALQPYHTRQPDTVHALQYIRAVANEDKHKRIGLVAGRAEASSARVDGPGVPLGMVVQGYSGPIVPGAIVARWRFHGVPEGFRPTLQVYPQITVAITLAEIEPALDVLRNFRGLADWIERIIFTKLDPFLC